jgi:hypothetical protein
MSRPKLTLGMATHRDFSGVWFSFQSLRLHHREAMKDVELIVVDNDPDSEHGKTVRDFMGWVKGDVAGARYIPAPEVVGTSAPRNRVFEEASGKAVLCMDCHVLLDPGVVSRLIRFYDEHPDCKDLLQGPMIYDDLRNVSTHFDPVWRAEMYGVWGTDRRADPNSPEYTDEPFEIWAQGLGLFTCRKDAWLGFNPKARGFGGEEGYIQEKFRRAGHKALCLPWLRWLHRFGRPGGVSYPLNVWNKVRNYVLFFHELGKPLDEIKLHFVDTVNQQLGRSPMPLHEWEELAANPSDPPEQPRAFSQPDFKAAENCKTCPGGGVNPEATLEQLYKAAHEVPGDINEHVPALRELASQCESVVEFGMRRAVSTVALLAGQPRRFVTYDLNADAVTDALKTRQGKCDFEFRQGSSLTVELDFEPTMLFIDTKHTADHLWKELVRHAPRVKRWIVLHDTVVFGERGEDGSAGLLPAVRRYLRENPEWVVAKHWRNNNGLLLLSRDPADKKQLPSTVRQAWNYAKAKAAHVVHGSKVVGAEQFEARLGECMLCESRADNRCAECGCFLDQGPNGEDGKALWKDSECPLGKWAAVDQKFSLPVVA